MWREAGEELESHGGKRYPAKQRRLRPTMGCCELLNPSIAESLPSSSQGDKVRSEHSAYARGNRYAHVSAGQSDVYCSLKLVARQVGPSLLVPSAKAFLESSGNAGKTINTTLSFDPRALRGVGQKLAVFPSNCSLLHSPSRYRFASL